MELMPPIIEFNHHTEICYSGHDVGLMYLGRCYEQQIHFVALWYKEMKIGLVPIHTSTLANLQGFYQVGYGRVHDELLYDALEYCTSIWYDLGTYTWFQQSIPEVCKHLNQFCKSGNFLCSIPTTDRILSYFK